MRDILNTYFLRRVIMWLVGVKATDFDRIVEWVKNAEANLTGDAKGEFVRKQIELFLPVLTGWVMNLMVEMALGFAIKKGWIEA